MRKTKENGFSKKTKWSRLRFDEKFDAAKIRKRKRNKKS